MIFLCDPKPPRPDRAVGASMAASRPLAKITSSSLKKVLNESVVEHIDREDEIVPGADNREVGAVEILDAPEDIVNTELEMVDAASESRIESEAEANVELMDDVEPMEAVVLCFL